MSKYIFNILAIICIGVVFLYSCSSSPSIEWEKTIDWSVIDEAANIIQTKDGGYIILAKKNVATTLVKLNDTGDVLWVKEIGDDYSEVPNAILQTKDGEFIVVGAKYGISRDTQDFWLVKLSESGDVIWDTLYDAGANREAAIDLAITDDGDYIVLGEKLNYVNDTFENNFWISKIDNNGKILWSKVMGGSGMDTPVFISKTEAGTFIIEGKTYSEDGDVPGEMFDKSWDSYDIWSVEIDIHGSVVNSKRKHGNYYIEQNPQLIDGNAYITVGSKWSGSAMEGSVDLSIEKTGLYMNHIWTKNIEKPGKDEPIAIKKTKDGGYIVLASVFLEGKYGSEIKKRIIKLEPDL